MVVVFSGNDHGQQLFWVFDINTSKNKYQSHQSHPSVVNWGPLPSFLWPVGGLCTAAALFCCVFLFARILPPYYYFYCCCAGVAQIRGLHLHNRFPPRYGLCIQYFRDNISALSALSALFSLVDTRRIFAYHTPCDFCSRFGSRVNSPRAGLQEAVTFDLRKYLQYVLSLLFH